MSQTAAAPKPRLGFFYLPHGAIMDNTRYGKEMNRWTPDIVGRDFDLKPILEPFAPLKQHMTVVSGLGNKPAESPSVHAIIPGTWLSCVPPPRSQSPNAGISVDQIAARHIGQETPLPSLEIATEERGGTSGCDGTYGCSYSRTISFRTPTTPLPMEADPGKVFAKIFGRGNTAAEREDIAKDFTSVLDMVRGRSPAPRARPRRGRPRDRQRLPRQRARARAPRGAAEGTRSCRASTVPELPVAVPDLDAQLQADVRPARGRLSDEHDAHRDVHDDGRGQQHAVPAHRRAGRVPSAVAPRREQAVDARSSSSCSAITARSSPGFLDKLAQMPDGDAGSVLDNSIFLYGSNMSNSNKHDSFPLPTLVFGHGGGIKGHQHLRYPDRTPLANLLFTLMLRAGVPVESVGDSTGEFAEV